MSIEALLQAAEYLDRKERGKAIFLANIYNNLDAKSSIIISLVIIDCLEISVLRDIHIMPLKT